MKSKSGWLALGNPTSISLNPICTSVSNMRRLRAGSMGSIRAWLPSRRSTEHHRGALVMRWLGQERSSSASGSGRKGWYFSNGIFFGVTGSGGIALSLSCWLGNCHRKADRKAEKPPEPNRRRRRGEHLCGVLASGKKEAGDRLAHRSMVPKPDGTSQDG